MASQCCCGKKFDAPFPGHLTDYMTAEPWRRASHADECDGWLVKQIYLDLLRGIAHSGEATALYASMRAWRDHGGDAPAFEAKRDELPRRT